MAEQQTAQGQGGEETGRVPPTPSHTTITVTLTVRTADVGDALFALSEALDGNYAEFDCTYKQEQKPADKCEVEVFNHWFHPSEDGDEVGEGYVCIECGDPCFMDWDGVTHHGQPDNIDHDTDADHVAIPE